MEVKFEKFIDGKQFTYDASTLGELLRCARLYNWSVLERRRPKIEGAPINWGRAVHHGLKVFEDTWVVNKIGDLALDAAIVAMLTEYGNCLKNSNDNARSVETAIRALVWKTDQFKHDQLVTATQEDGAPLTEVRFEVPFIEGYRLSGVIDRLVLFEKNFYPLDYKTTKSSLDKKFFDRYSPSTQFFVYVWVMRNAFELNVPGYIIDGVQTLVNSTRFGRQIYYLSDAQLDEWLEDIKWCLKEVDAYAKANYWPGNYESCAEKGGCQFRHICAMPKAERQRWLDAEFPRTPLPGQVETQDAEAEVDASALSL